MRYTNQEVISRKHYCGEGTTCTALLAITPNTEGGGYLRYAGKRNGQTTR
jgi:hypothetical protein